MTVPETAHTTSLSAAADASHNTGPLRTELVCYEPYCRFTTFTPFPMCVDELAAHDCPEVGATDGR